MTASRFLLGAVLIFGALPAAAATNSWSRLGASTATFDCVAVHPANASVMYACVRDFGIMKTTDGGATWATVLPVGFLFSSVAIDPQAPSTVYASAPSIVTFGAALYKSTDAGATWSLANFGLTRAVEAITIDPVNPATVYAQTRDGPYVFKSTNRGSTWFSIRDAAVQSVTPDPVLAGRLYASHQGGVARSSDGGVTWELRTITPGTWYSLAVDPGTSRVYAGSMSDGSMFESADGGDTWQALPGVLVDAVAPSFRNVRHIAVTPGSPPALFVSRSCDVIKSLDGGDSWTDASNGLPFFSASNVTRPCVATPPSMAPGPAGSGLLVGAVTNPFNAVTNGLFQYAHNASLLVPSCSLGANPAVVQPGASSTLTAYCTPQPTSYVWSANTGFSSSATGGTVSPTQNTTYTVQGVNANGSGNVAAVTVNTVNGRVVNISTRSQVLVGAQSMIAGFIIPGVTDKTVVIRARGPSLAAAGISNPLANPLLSLRGRFGQVILNNNDWRAATNAAAIEASGFAPGDDLESAILIRLPPGPYTAIVEGSGGGTGVGIVEVFEVDTPENPLLNISTRASVGTGPDVVIAGFIIQGTNPATLVIRGRGPSIASFAPTYLANPVLQLFSGQTLLATNDDWYTDANAAQIQQLGYAPFYSQESAMLVTLQPGAYTAVMSGTNSGTGVGLVEVFRLP